MVEWRVLPALVGDVLQGKATLASLKTGKLQGANARFKQITHYLAKSDVKIKPSCSMNQSHHILELARSQRMLRAADVRKHGWSSQLLIRLHQAGKVQRIAWGLYGLPDAEITEHQTLIEVCQRVLKAVLCLLSPLQLHRIGTQMPDEVWIALPEATRTPALS